MVVHTGDITNAKSLERFSGLECGLVGVFGNNDRGEIGLQEVVKKNGFNFQNPPLEINLNNLAIAIFHEPEFIDEYLKDNNNVDLILHGHTHRYREDHIDGTLIFNPGECAGFFKGKNSVGVINLCDLSAERIFF